MEHPTKYKGDIAVAMTIADLTIKGYTILAPIVCENLPFDLIAYKDNISYRIQVKYSNKGNIKNKTNWVDKNGNHVKKYNFTDFDYYAIYLPDKNLIVYPSVRFGGLTIRTSIPDCATRFYWYEDFLTFTDSANKKNYKDFNFEITKHCGDRINNRKVIRPAKEELEKLIWEFPTVKLAKQFGVSDKAIEKWCKRYNISKPPRGYWRKKINSSN